MPTMQHSLEVMLAEGHEAGAFPAAAAAIGVHDNVLARAFIGGAPLPEDAPVDAHTKFDMASLSKVLGPTMIVLRAMEDGALTLDETIGDFFPSAPQDKRGITVRQLMTHTGGFNPSFRLDQLCQSPDEVLDCILRYPLDNPPGLAPSYSCMGFITLAKMLEQRFGESLSELARKRVFEPLGMTGTGYCPFSGVCAATEVDSATGRPWIGVVHDENARYQGGVSGNAGVFMPLCDGEKFAAMLAQMGGGYLRRETLEMAIRNYTPGFDEHRGLGFHLAGTAYNFMSDKVPDHCFGHTGFTGTSLIVEPDTGFWVLLLTNRVYPTRASSALFPFRRKLHGTCWTLYQEGVK